VRGNDPNLVVQADVVTLVRGNDPDLVVQADVVTLVRGNDPDLVVQARRLDACARKRPGLRITSANGCWPSSGGQPGTCAPGRIWRGLRGDWGSWTDRGTGTGQPALIGSRALSRVMPRACQRSRVLEEDEGDQGR
jgi:hypothetical protein